jgi:hypothetical protein
MKYLLDVKFYAGSDEQSDVDRGLYLLSVEKRLSGSQMREIFKKVNSLCDPFSDKRADFPTYDEGLNIETLMEGVETYLTGSKVTKLEADYSELPRLDSYYIIDQWQ